MALVAESGTRTHCARLIRPLRPMSFSSNGPSSVANVPEQERQIDQQRQLIERLKYTADAASVKRARDALDAMCGSLAEMRLRARADKIREREARFLAP